MIKSMTGYGSGEGGGFAVEMRSVNHKFLDLSMRLPRDIMPLEGRLKKLIGERFTRGRIDVNVTRGGGEEAPRALKLDHDVAKQYVGLLNELKNTFDLPGEIDLGLVASFKEIVSGAEAPMDIEEAWSALQTPLAACMDSLDGMRTDEGKALASDILSRTSTIAGLLDEVEKRSPVVVTEHAQRLKERVEKLAQGVVLDPDRLHQEVVIFAERSDITEEIVRGRSHIRQLEELLRQDGAAGRKMDFLLQEINREVNTIASKASDYELSRSAVLMKSELEKIREQVQNIE